VISVIRNWAERAPGSDNVHITSPTGIIKGGSNDPPTTISTRFRSIVPLFAWDQSINLQSICHFISDDTDKCVELDGL